MLEKADTLSDDGLLDDETESGQQMIVVGGEGDGENLVEDVAEDVASLENDLVAPDSDEETEGGGIFSNLLGTGEEEYEKKEEV